MHIVGLLGMTRREYTYSNGLGWQPYNLAETIGGYITALGILLLLGNLVWSYFTCEEAGPDPWHGPTLEWTTSSPPPPYNYAVIPYATSAYPNWDDDDRQVDRDKLARGVLVLQEGHEQPAVGPVDGRFDEIVEMPHDSPWPALLGLSLLLLILALVMGKFGVAGVLGIVCLAVLFGWHSKEPQEA
jgi:cytochrome c oxidase subunit 1/cytochrome c oxidase subunit I+III